jgi:hypothetical protein
MHLLLTLSILILIAVIVFLYLYFRREEKKAAATIDDFTGDINDFIDDFNSKHSSNIPKLNSKMRHVAALYELSKKHGLSAHELLQRLTDFDINNCAFSCQSEDNCAACCNKNCTGASDHVNCMQHCGGVDCSNMCTDANDYTGCRQCCERNCNINDYDGQMKCIKMCDANYTKQYSSCSDQCSDTTTSPAACTDCCGKNCNGTDNGLCAARCSEPMLRFILKSHILD